MKSSHRGHSSQIAPGVGGALLPHTSAAVLCPWQKWPYNAMRSVKEGSVASFSSLCPTRRLGIHERAVDITQPRSSRVSALIAFASMGRREAGSEVMPRHRRNILAYRV